MINKITVRGQKVITQCFFSSQRFSSAFPLFFKLQEAAVTEILLAPLCLNGYWEEIR